MSTSGVVECEADQAVEFPDLEFGAVEITDQDVDFIQEIRLRTWARRNYVPQTDRNEDWHPVILHEMIRIDQEG